MSAPLISPEASVAEQSRKSFQDQLNGLGGLNGPRLSTEAKAKKLREACEGFESIFIQKMWQEMRNTVPKAGLLQGREEKFWQDMYDQELSKSMTKAGGIGLADMMYEQLSRNLGDASRVAAGNVSMAAFTPGAAPLVTENMPVEKFEPELAEPAISQVASTAPESVYEGAAPTTAPVAAETPEATPAQAGEAPQIVQPVQASLTGTQILQNSRPVQDEQPKAKARKVEKTRDNGIDLAYKARRDAGDKLGSRAIRPPLHKRKEQQPAVEPLPEMQPLQAQAPMEAPKPGTAESLRAAVELSRSGAEIGETARTGSLNDLVNQVRQKNAAQAAMPAAAPVSPTASPDTVETGDGEPGLRRVRKITNMPRKANSKKNPEALASQGDSAIRMLNVDNARVTTKSGQGIAAYHAAQEAAKSAPMAAHLGNTAQAAPTQGQIQPLTASDPGDDMGLSFSVPPLTGADPRG